MKIQVATVGLTLCLTLMSAGPIYSQTLEATSETTAATVADVYVQVTTGVNVYHATAAGRLTLVEGSPFSIAGQMEGITGSHLLSVGTTILHSYEIASNGAVGSPISSINTATYDGEDCGPTTGNQAVLDHSGKYFYVQLSGGPTTDGCEMNDWQTYKIGSSGDFTFIGNAYPPYYNWSPNTAPVFNSSDKYAYSITQLTLDDEIGFFPFTRISDGYISLNTGFTESDPAHDTHRDYYLEPLMAAADPHEHLAVLMLPFSDCEGGGPPCLTEGDLQLASYTIDPETGGISTAGTQADLPFVQLSWALALDVSWDGKFVAIGGSQLSADFVAGTAGLQVFKFNGAGLPTRLTALLLPGTQIDQVAWDKADHLYALSYETQKLYVFNVSAAHGAVQIGEPTIVHGAFGLTGIIVVPK
jgi:hypothetical protein